MMSILCAPGYHIKMIGVPRQIDNYLVHFGIKGQHWGIRRFQNEDRTLTQEGKRRYGVGDGRGKYDEKNDDTGYAVRTDSEREKTAKRLELKLNDAKNRSEAASEKLYEASNLRYTSDKYDAEYSKAYLEHNKIEQEIRDIKILQKINNQKRISQHRLNLEAKYKEKGMTDDQAKVAAYKRDKTEKIVAVAAVTTLAVASAWLYKNHMADIDKVIPKDTMIQNLSADPNKGIQDAFYASYDPADNRKYMRLFGGGHLQGMNNPIAKLLGFSEKVDVQKMSAQVMSEMRIAGANVGRETANELISTSHDYRQAIKDMLNSHGVGSNKNLGLLMEMNGMPGYRNVQDAVYNGKALNKQGYNFINRMLVDHSSAGQTAGESLFNALRKKGYDGTIDLNDVFNSGYDAKAPIVVFNGAGKLGNITRATIDPDTLQLGKNYELAKIYGKQILNFAVPAAAAVGASNKASDIYQRRRAERNLIKQYKKEHPKTKLSNEEILRNVM